jgi:hypothetical protein
MSQDFIIGFFIGLLTVGLAVAIVKMVRSRG